MTSLINFTPFIPAGLVWATVASATGQNWPVPIEPIMQGQQAPASYSHFATLLRLTPSHPIQDFAAEIAAVYAALLEGQEPLGAEFAAVWEMNVDRLYEP